MRETINQMLEAWKEVPDLPDDISPRPESNSSSKGIQFLNLFRRILYSLYMFSKSDFESRYEYFFPQSFFPGLVIVIQFV